MGSAGGQLNGGTMKADHRILFILHWIVGLGAAAGGLSAVINPLTPMGIPAETLQYSPFSTFLIPGLFLLIVLGLGNIAGALASGMIPPWKGYIGTGMGTILVLWIVVQCYMLRDIVFLHILFLLIGIFQALVSLKVIKEARA